MKEKFKLIPKIIKRQIIIRGLLGITFLMLFIILIATTKDFILSFPCVILAAYLAVNSFIVFLASIDGKVICIDGQCSVMERSSILKRIKSVTVDTECGRLKIPIRKRQRNLKIGCQICLYVNEKTPIFENNELKAVSSYYAIEIRS